MNAHDALATIRANGCRPFVGEDGNVYITGPHEVVDALVERFENRVWDLGAVLQEYEVQSASDIVKVAESIAQRPRCGAQMVESKRGTSRRKVKP